MALCKCIIGCLPLLTLCGGAGALAADPPPDGNNKPQQQTPNPTDTTQTLGTIYVTGTHIRSVDIETANPVKVLDHDAILRSGLTGVADVVQSLIVAGGQSLNRNINNPPVDPSTNFDGKRGESRVNLRSLGADRTLILVNGRRWASAVDGAVDLSAIPLALVDRVEVLKDGASAIYGSDAIGGVINIITRRDYSGAELDLYAGETDHGDGRSRHADFSFGRSGNKWNASFGVEWGDDDPIFAETREISSVPSPGLPFDATASSSSQYGRFFVQGFRGSMVLIAGRPGTSPDDFRRFNRAVDNNYNYIPYNYLQTPQQRRAAFGQFRREFSPTFAFSADVLFHQRRSAQQLAPPVVGFSAAAGTADAFSVSPQNIYNPFGVPVDVTTRWPDSEPRRFEQSVDTTRFHFGLDGLFQAFGRDWNWNADATRTRVVQSESAGPYADDAKLALAVGPSFHDANGVAHCGTPDSVIEGCVPLDLFTGPGRYTQAMTDYVNAEIHNDQRARSDSLDFNVTSTLADLPAGALGFAAGVERRLERGSDIPDPLIASGRANGTGNTNAPTHGAYSVNEAYLEFDIPLLADMPLARKLDVNLATRYSDYSLFGSTDNSRVGLRWKPVDELLFRATWSQGFRAPSIFEAFGGETRGPGGVIDLCETQEGYTPSPQIAANCLAQGVPGDVPESDATYVIMGSNPDLRPETSRSLTAGLVFSPAGLPGFDASLDWYRIEIRDAIADYGPQRYVGACYRNNDPEACTHITRLPDGEISQIVAIEENLPGGLETEGWDFGLHWKRKTSMGDLDFSWDNAYVDYWGAIGRPPRGTPLPDGSLAAGNIAGKNDDAFGGLIWRLRSVATLAWQRKSFGASISARYFSPIVEDCSVVIHTADIVQDPSLYSLCSDPDHLDAGSAAPRNRVGAVTYVDLETSWDAPWKARIAFGIRNAFDRNPPLARSYSSLNSFFPDYDIPGRFYYASYRQKF
ncbi:MAG TPA: TonB-dependent receptor [Rhodanobacteraceae bacterium]|nr:TonB-dependent receptor [Rhodanobacteraceae bacterium]